MASNCHVHLLTKSRSATLNTSATLSSCATGLNSESSSAFAENKSSVLRVPASNHFGIA